MGLTDLFTRYVFNGGSRRWLDAGTGQFVSEVGIADELAHLQAASNRTLEQLTKQLYAGDIKLSDWQLAVATELKDAHLAQAAFARGGRPNMGPQQLGRVGGNLADEYRHLDKFAGGIADGSVSEAQALSRINQYGDATDQAYQREWAIQRRRPEWEGLPTLNQVPRDGGTVCHGHCNCQLDEHEDGIHWVLYPGESCDDCQGLADHGPYQPGNV